MKVLDVLYWGSMALLFGVLGVGALLMLQDTDVNAQTHSGLTSSGCPAPYTAAGSIMEHGSPGNTITVTTAGTYYPWTSGHVDILVGGMAADIDDAIADHLTVPRNSAYLVVVSSSFAATGGAVVECDLFFNGVLSDFGFIRKMGTGGLADIGVVSSSGVTQLAPLTEISYRCTSDDNGDQVVIYHLHVSALEILGS